ncbi:MlaD family protein [Flagellimonas meridianipacifica]|uniref:Phospholipid/cholesterol/gamma-HCH transport system substrate-binding protein n=1 Tax=Flagellimonas meridianipacifica TaxID=1080225 RepID=A0A2T0MAW1_9FLAO|nr:MlaD family protein [Allomuricauda pacifica]PRX54633.1 phospholipid/cholesterol/gamma-HCH transport system substrate-binding protein [Allomuricauda pacifica]
MEKTTVEKIRLGVFVILGTILLVIAAYLIGNRQNLFGSTFSINAVFKNVNGLQRGNNVRYSGIDIGTVNDIEMLNDTTIIVSMVIQDKMLPHIRKNAIASIGSDGLVGSMIVNITPGREPGLEIASGDQITSYSKIGADDMLSTLNVTNENAALLTADLLQITAALKNGEGTFGRLLNDTVMSKSLLQTSINLRKMTEEANLSLGKLNEIMMSIKFENSVGHTLLSDSLAGQQMKNILSNLEDSSEELVSITNNLDSLSSTISKGKGTINYLATDTIFVNRLERTMQSVEEGTARFNENMEALKHNFLTRRYFKKQEKEKTKKD